MTEATTATQIQSRPLVVAGALTWREIIRFFRQRNRVVAALGTPLLLWGLFGTGLNRAFAVGGQRFMEYYVPGTVQLILLFTAIFTTISIIEDRREGFLQAVLVAPIPRWSMVLGKLLGGSLIATAQALIFVVLALTLGIRFSLIDGLAILGWLFVSALGMTGLGFFLAWKMNSVQGFHAVMNLLLLPMWLLSGGFFPIPAIDMNSGFGELIMHWLMRLNPTTYAVAGLRELLGGSLAAKGGDGGPLETAIWEPSLAVCTVVVSAFAVVAFVMSCRISRRTTAGDLL